MPKNILVVTFTPDDIDRSGCGEDTSEVIGALTDTDPSDDEVLALVNFEASDDEEIRIGDDNCVETRYADEDEEDGWSSWEDYGWLKMEIVELK